MEDDAYYIDIANELDEGDFDVTTWEAGFLDTILNQGWVSEDQAKILLQMSEEYLEE